MNEQHVINVKVESFENLHQRFQICRKCFQFVATLFHLQQRFLIRSNYILLPATF